MRKIKFIFYALILFSTGCALFPNTFHKCSSLTGWCTNSPVKEIQRWGQKEKPKAECCSNNWSREISFRRAEVKRIFIICQVNPDTGKSLNKKSDDLGYQCLRNYGLCKVNVDKACK